MSSSQNSNLSRAPTPSPPPSLSQPLNNERRSWTREEEDALIVILKKLLVDGWRQENAFRTGYLNIALNMLQVRFSGTDLTSSKITSKLTVWKKDYYVVSEMINTSGFGWNDSSNTISVANDVWEEYARAHPRVKSLQGKSYRYYHDWVEIFGKDRATGKNAQGTKDLAKVANHEPYIPYFNSNEFPQHHTENEQVHNDIHHGVVPIEEEIADNPSSDECNSGNANKRDGVKKSQSRMKRNRLETTSKESIIVNLMEEFFKQQNQSIGTFIDKLDRRNEDSENNKPVDKTKLVLEALSKICSLTEENQLYFAYKIETDASVMDLFLNFSEGERITFVNMMLAWKVL